MRTQQQLHAVRSFRRIFRTELLESTSVHTNFANKIEQQLFITRYYTMCKTTTKAQSSSATASPLKLVGGKNRLLSVEFESL